MQGATPLDDRYAFLGFCEDARVEPAVVERVAAAMRRVDIWWAIAGGWASSLYPHSQGY